VNIYGVDPGLANCGLAVLVSGDLKRLAVFTSRTHVPATKKRRRRDVRLDERLRDHLEVARREGIRTADVLAIEVPSFPPGARPAALLFASFGIWLAGTASFCSLCPIATRTWRALLDLPPRATTEERKADVAAAMRRRWPAAEELMAAAKIPRGRHEHAWDALALATVALEAGR
jgi:hypothetical protein